MAENEEPQAEATPPVPPPTAKDPGKAAPPKAEGKIRFSAHMGAMMMRRVRNK